MMKKLLSILYSTRLTAILFIAFAAAMGIATFIENDYGTQTSKALVYNAWWFEAIMLLFVVNFFGNIFRYRLYKKEKWPVLFFHVSFILVIVGWLDVKKGYGRFSILSAYIPDGIKNVLKETIFIIPNLKISHYCNENIEHNEYKEFKCIYSSEFSKWIPLKLIK